MQIFVGICNDKIQFWQCFSFTLGFGVAFVSKQFVETVNKLSSSFTTITSHDYHSDSVETRQSVLELLKSAKHGSPTDYYVLE